MMNAINFVTSMLLLTAVSTAEPDQVPRSALPIPHSALLGDDVAWLSYALSVNLTKDESDCISGNKVLFEGDKQCYPHFSQGPCPKGQWLVLDMKTLTDNKQLQAKCRREPLEYLFGSCGQEKDYVLNPFGEFDCACSFGRVSYLSSEGSSCHQVYSREPCGNDAVLAPDLSLQRLHTAQCRQDPCSGRFPEPGVAVFQVEKDGATECHQVNSQGPCPDEGKVVVWKRIGALSGIGEIRLACDYPPAGWCIKC